MCQLKKKGTTRLYLGNLYAKRDWGHAKDYVIAMWKMMQKKIPDDYVIATGVQHSVKDFLNIVAQELNFKISWKGKGLSEKGYINNKLIISIDQRYFRPTEVESLLGDSRKARKKLGWNPKFDINKLVKDMIHKEFEKQSD